MNILSKWFLAARPKTLSISVSPVVVGCALSWQEQGQWSLAIFLLTLFTAVMIQVGTNLYNDVVDFERGTDTPARLGPERATAQGWFSSTAVKRAANLSFAAALLGGTYLTWIGGWPILVVGILSLFAGYGYTGGPRPIAYSWSGEMFVFIFFGLAAVLGSYYLQSGRVSSGALYCGIALGAFASAVMLVNNLRDLETDRSAGKLTLVHFLGRRRSQVLYATLVLSPLLLPAGPVAPGAWFVVLTSPFALSLTLNFKRSQNGTACNRILSQTAQLQLVYAALLSVGLVWWN